MSQDVNELFNLLLPLGTGRALTPRMAVAEVVGFSEPRMVDNAPEWLLGRMAWRDQWIPLLAFEGVCQDAVPAINTRSRVAVMHALSEQAAVSHFGVVTQGFPQLISVYREALKLAPVSDELRHHEAILSHVTLAERPALIPNFDYVEQQLWSVITD